jgi:acetolactate synthase I/III small subunit
VRRTLSIWVENRSGELLRIVGLFAARGYNIESLTVADTPQRNISLVTVVTTGTDHAIEQIVKRVDKQVCVLKALDVTDLRHAEREIAVVSVKLNVGPALREVLQLVARNRLKLVDVSQETLTLEATGDWAAINEIIALLSSLGIRDIVRSGAVAVADLPPRAAGQEALHPAMNLGPAVPGFSDSASKAEL